MDKIKAPLLIAQGANDPRVPKNESDQMVQALKERGVDVPYLVKENEGHGFRNEENRFDFYRKMEAFLGKYLISYFFCQRRKSYFLCGFLIGTPVSHVFFKGAFDFLQVIDEVMLDSAPFLGEPTEIFRIAVTPLNVDLLKITRL